MPVSRPESILVIKNSLPCWTEQLTLTSKSCVPMRLLLIQESARFSLGSNSSCAECPVLHSSPFCSPSQVSLTPLLLLLNLNLNNSAMFPVPFFSSHTNIKCIFVRSTGNPFPDQNLMFHCLVRFQS